MSSISFRRPEFRLHLGYPDIVLTSAGRTLGRVATAAGGFSAALTGLTEPVRRVRGRLVAVLPDPEVWRGRLDLAGRNHAERRASARTIVAGRLGTSPDDVTVVIGARDPCGSFAVAGVRRSTLFETRALLAAVGLRPSAIVGTPGFLTSPRLDGGWSWPLPTLPPERSGLAAATAAGAIVTLAVVALGLPNPDTPPAAPAPQPAVAEAALPPVALPPVAEVALPAPPPPLALASSAPPKPRPPASPGEPLVTVAARNMPPDLPIEIAKPRPSPVQRLAGLAAAPARALDTITAPLRRPAAKPAPAPDVAEVARTAMPALPAPAVAAELRPMRRPQTEAAEPAPAAKGAAVAPRPRERAGSAEPALLVASLEPAPLVQASIATATAAAVAAAVAEPPPARPAALESVAKRPAPVPAKPVVVRPRPIAQPAPAPARQKVAAQPAPVKAAPVKAAPVRTASLQPARVKPVPVPPVPVKSVRVKSVPVKPVAAKTVPVRQAAKQVRQVAPQPVAAVAPVVAAKPEKARPANHRVGLSRGNVSLVGVFAGADGRHALVRLPNGNIERVKAGDRVQGVQVAAVNADSVRLTGRGKDTLLRLPD